MRELIWDSLSPNSSVLQRHFLSCPLVQPVGLALSCAGRGLSCQDHLMPLGIKPLPYKKYPLSKVFHSKLFYELCMPEALFNKC